MQISVPHIGEDYGKVQVKHDDGTVEEFETNYRLAKLLRKVHGSKDLEA